MRLRDYALYFHAIEDRPLCTALVEMTLARQRNHSLQLATCAVAYNVQAPRTSALFRPQYKLRYGIRKARDNEDRDRKKAAADTGS